MCRQISLGAVLFVFSLFSCPAAGQDAKAAFDAMIKSIGWTKDLKSFEVLLVARDSRTVELQPAPNGTFKDAILKRRILKKTSGEFLIIESCGSTSVSFVEGSERTREGVYSNVFFGDDRSAKQVDYPSGSEGDFRCPHQGQSCFDIASGSRWELSTLPFKFMFSMPDAEIQAEFDRQMETLFQCPPRNIYVETIRNSDKRRVKVYRVRRINPKTESTKAATVTYTVEVSDEGFDAGMVTNIQVGWMKSELQNETFKNDDQLDSFPRYSSAIRWKEISTHDGQSTKVVPTHIVQSMLKASFAKSTQNITLEWKSMNNGELKLPPLSSCGEECLQMRKDIDKVLRR